MEHTILTDPQDAYLYAKNVMKSRWEEAEKIIALDSSSAYLYAKDVIKGRWTGKYAQLAEDVIRTTRTHIRDYHRDVVDRNYIGTILQKDWDLLLTSPKWSYEYAKLHGRNDQIEAMLISDRLATYHAYRYAKDVIKGRWEAAEMMILSDDSSAYKYARDVIKGRWDEAEKTITSVDVAYKYARDVIKGRWKIFEDEIMQSDHRFDYIQNILLADTICLNCQMRVH